MHSLNRLYGVNPNMGDIVLVDLRYSSETTERVTVKLNSLFGVCTKSCGANLMLNRIVPV